MDISIKISNIIFLYKNLLNKLEIIDLNFDDAILLYSIKIGKDKISTISDFIEKDKSYVHRKIHHLIKKNLVVKENKRYLLSYKGKAIYKKLSLFNRMLINECEHEGIDVENFKELITKFGDLFPKT